MVANTIWLTITIMLERDACRKLARFKTP